MEGNKQDAGIQNDKQLGEEAEGKIGTYWMAWSCQGEFLWRENPTEDIFL